MTNETPPTDVVLLPCRFCGDRLRILHHTRKNGTEFWRLFCNSDGDCFFMDFGDEAEAIEMANRRPSSMPAAPEEVEALLEACKDALDQLWHLAKDKDNNPWLKQLRAAISAYEARRGKEDLEVASHGEGPLMSGWQPIETAARDGDHHIIGWCKQWREPIQLRWLSGLGKWSTAFQPTHWMPLPSPPDAGDEVAEQGTTRSGVEPPSGRPSVDPEAVEAARRIVGGHQRSLTGYFEEGDPLRVATALLASASSPDRRDSALTPRVEPSAEVIKRVAGFPPRECRLIAQGLEELGWKLDDFIEETKDAPDETLRGNRLLVYALASEFNEGGRE